ncbi:MAG: hypothetical protein ACOCM4_10265 [Acetivibrio ethanolgignens]
MPQKFYSGMNQFYDYMNKIIEHFHIDIAVYRSSSSDAVQKKKNMPCLYLFIEDDKTYYVWPL